MLGNGKLGGLLWGSGDTLRLSLDRGDLWDLRTPEIYTRDDWNYATLQRLVAEGNQEELVKLFDAPYVQVPYPTKLAVGRLVLRLAGQTSQSFELDLARAEATVELDGARVQTIFSATPQVALVRIEGARPELSLVPPAALEQLGAPEAELGRESGSDGELVWLTQAYSAGAFAIAAQTRVDGEATTIAITIERASDSETALRAARNATLSALGIGYEAMRAAHYAWWQDLWSTSDVTVPDERIQAQYDLAMYLYASASRLGSPPIPLQGVWTADNGGLPPWKGDYHNDLNTQTTYLAYHTAGLHEQGMAFLDFLTERLPRFRRFAREFYGVEGAVVPGVMALDGSPLAGWGQYALSPTNGAWVAQSFYLHWRHHPTEEFLRLRAYPFCSEIGDAIAALLVETDVGMLRLPLSSSPEIFDNSLRAWLPPNSNYDLALMKWLFGALAEMAEAFEAFEASERWTALRDRLEPFDIDESTGSLTFARGIPYAASHRHFSHAMALHPLDLINIRGSEAERETTLATLRVIEEHGTRQWVGYSFAWMACMLARAERGDDALRYLSTYANAFTSRNGFHLNGDQTGGEHSDFTYRPFTLEGNFLAMEAVRDLLLASHGETVQVFPATPSAWATASFEKLRAQGGYVVSAKRAEGQTTEVEIRAQHDGTLVLTDPFGEDAGTWEPEPTSRADSVLFFELRRGATVRGRRE